MTDYDQPMIGVLLSNDGGELYLPQWVREDFAEYTQNPEVLYYMTNDLRTHPDMPYWVEENQHILQKVHINVRVQKIPKKFKNHYHIKINEDFSEEIVLNDKSYELYLKQWNQTCKMRYISTVLADTQCPADEKIRRIETRINIGK
jgi:hypothetical protein